MAKKENMFHTAGAPDAVLTRQCAAILAVGEALKGDSYHFVAPTPATYARVLKRSRPSVYDPLLETFGWNRPFLFSSLDRNYLDLLTEADLIVKTDAGELRSKVRFSSLDGMLFAHSGFPTDERDSVFFGPDTYRYVRAVQCLRDRNPTFAPQTIIDVGAGTGAGGIVAASIFPGHRHIVLTDISAKALAYAQINASLNGVRVETCQSDVLQAVEARGDLIISNPPYLVDRKARAYRNGGGAWGCALAVRILEESLQRLTKTGQLLLYTGAPVLQGEDMFLKAALPTLNKRCESFRYEELDPDVFGEELENPPYDRADRIASVVLHVKAADIYR